MNPLLPCTCSTSPPLSLLYCSRLSQMYAQEHRDRRTAAARCCCCCCRARGEKGGLQERSRQQSRGCRRSRGQQQGGRSSSSTRSSGCTSSAGSGSGSGGSLPCRKSCGGVRAAPLHAVCGSGHRGHGVHAQGAVARAAQDTGARGRAAQARGWLLLLLLLLRVCTCACVCTRVCVCVGMSVCHAYMHVVFVSVPWAGLLVRCAARGLSELSVNLE